MAPSSTQHQHARLTPSLFLAFCLLHSSPVSGFTSVKRHDGVIQKTPPMRTRMLQLEPRFYPFSSTSLQSATMDNPKDSPTSLSQSSMVADYAVTPAWDTKQRKPSLLAKVRAFAYDLSPAATSDKVPSYKKLLTFAATMGLVFISEPLLSLVDTSVVGWTQGATSVIQLASMGPATTLMDTLIYMTYFLALGTNSLLSQGLAEGRWRDLQKTTSNIMAVAACVGLGLTGFIWFASPTLLKAMAGAACTPELLQYAVSYTRIRALVAPAAIMGLVAQSFCMANHSTKAPLLAVLVASVLNVSGDLILSKQGVVGAAIATGVATVSASAVLFVAVRKRLNEWRRKEVNEWEALQTGKPISEEGTQLLESTSVPEKTQQQLLKSSVVSKARETTKEKGESAPQVPKRVPFLSLPDRKSLVDLASVSGPLCFNMWAKMGCYSALTLAATQFGVVPLAAHNILMRLFFFFGCFADSISMSAQSFLPRTLYPLDKRSYRATLRRLMAVAVVTSVFLGKAAMVVLNTAGTYLARDGAMFAAMKSQGPYLAAALALHPLVVLAEGTVIATRDFRNLIMTYASVVCVHAYLLTNATTFSAVWKALVGFQCVRAVSYRLWRNRKHELVSSSA